MSLRGPSRTWMKEESGGAWHDGDSVSDSRTGGAWDSQGPEDSRRNRVTGPERLSWRWRQSEAAPDLTGLCVTFTLWVWVSRAKISGPITSVSQEEVPLFWEVGLEEGKAGSRTPRRG